jgi:hypothetical protein
MSDGLSEDEADTSDLRCMDKGVRFIARVRGRPGGECGEIGMSGEGETLLTCDDGSAGLG